MRARVAVTAGKRHSGLGQTQLRPDDVDDALVHAIQPEKFHTKLFNVLLKSLS